MLRSRASAAPIKDAKPPSAAGGSGDAIAGDETLSATNSAAEAPIELRVARLDYTVARIRDRVQESGGVVQRRRRRWLADGSRVVTLTVQIPGDRVAAMYARLNQLAPSQTQRFANGNVADAYNTANVRNYGNATAREERAVSKHAEVQDRSPIGQGRQATPVQNQNTANAQYGSNGALQQNATARTLSAQEAQQATRNNAAAFVTLTIVVREDLSSAANQRGR
jgi:hypothetical protein